LRRTRVKICGITREEDLVVSILAGADAVGFLVDVPSSPRNLTLEKAKKLVRQVPVFVESVVVTAPHSIERLTEICEKLKPTAIQIHGNENFKALEIREKIKYTRLIKTVYVTENSVTGTCIEDFKTFDAVLLDSFTKGQYGGTGKIHDWRISRQIKDKVAPLPVILAGGLKPENVEKAIFMVQPYAVDVASGVELRPAIKDYEKIKIFVENAKKIKLPDN
jgi:phosphoribosylanthranilate isomerase